MEAKDTVLSDEMIQIAKNIPLQYDLAQIRDLRLDAILLAQAKATWAIAFEAGEKEMFKKLRCALRGEPTVFDYALDAVEIEWIYSQTRISHILL